MTIKSLHVHALPNEKAPMKSINTIYQMLGQLERKESSLVDFSISAFAAFSFFRLAAPLSYRRCLIFRAYQTLPEFYLSLTIKISLLRIYFPMFCQDRAVQTNSGRPLTTPVSEKFSARSKTKGSSHTIGKKKIILRDRGAPFVPRGPG